MKAKYGWLKITVALLFVLPSLVSAQWLEATISLPDSSGPCALCWNSTNNKVYCANRDRANITVVDGGNNSIITTIPVGGGPCALLWNPRNNKVYCTNSTSANVTVIDGGSNSVIATIPVGGGPRALCWNSTKNKVYCADRDSSSLTVIDSGADSVVTTIRLPTGFAPGRMTWNALNNKIYCENWFSVIVINGENDSLITQIATGYYASNLIWHSASNKVYHAYTRSDFAANSGRVQWTNTMVIDGRSDSVITRIYCGYSYSGDLVWNATNDKVYCWRHGWDGGLTVIDAGRDSVIGEVISGDPLIWNSRNNKVYCTDWGNSVIVVNGVTDSVIVSIPVGDEPCAAAWNSVQNRTYVANRLSSTISVIRDSMTGIEEQNDARWLMLDTRLKILQNPTTAKQGIRLIVEARSQTSEARLRLYDVSGKVVRSLPIANNHPPITIRCNPGDRRGAASPAGVYFVRLEAAGTTLTRKVVVVD